MHRFSAVLHAVASALLSATERAEELPSGRAGCWNSFLCRGQDGGGWIPGFDAIAGLAKDRGELDVGGIAGVLLSRHVTRAIPRRSSLNRTRRNRDGDCAMSRSSLSSVYPSSI